MSRAQEIRGMWVLRIRVPRRLRVNRLNHWTLSDNLLLNLGSHGLCREEVRRYGELLRIVPPAIGYRR